MKTESQKAQFFICHASDDKDEFVRPLAKYFLKSGASIFYDEYSIKLGDSISSKINQGLKEAEVAIIVLSYSFFQKNWPEAELQSLINRQISGKTRLVIIYHGVSHEEVADRYPLLQDLFGISSSIGVEKLASKIFDDTSFSSQIS